MFGGKDVRAYESFEDSRYRGQTLTYIDRNCLAGSVDFSFYFKVNIQKLKSETKIWKAKINEAANLNWIAKPYHFIRESGSEGNTQLEYDSQGNRSRYGKERGHLFHVLYFYIAEIRQGQNTIIRYDYIFGFYYISPSLYVHVEVRAVRQTALSKLIVVVARILVEVELTEPSIAEDEVVDVEVDRSKVVAGGAAVDEVVDTEVEVVPDIVDEARVFNAIEAEDGERVEKYVEAMLWVTVVDASVAVISFVTVAVGTTSSKTVETTASIRDVEVPVIVENVVVVAAGTRQAIVPRWSNIIDIGSLSPPEIHRWLHVGEFWPVHFHRRNASPFGTSEGMLNIASCRSPRHAIDSNP
jgi:hypothetical protein